MQETTRYNLTIGGKSVPTSDHFEVRNPSTGEVVGLAPKASAADLDHAVDAARDRVRELVEDLAGRAQEALPRGRAEARRSIPKRSRA